MAEAELVQGSPLMVDYVPGGAIAAGEVVEISSQAYVAHRAIASGATGALAWPNGAAVYKFYKDPTDAEAIAVGAAVKWSSTKVLAAGGTHVGYCTKAAATTDNHVYATLERLA